MNKVCILGLGYIGLPTASLFAANGHKVIGVDINSKVIESINQKKLPFKESNLKPILEKAIEEKTLIAKTEPEEADVFIISVPTPFDKEQKKADLSHVIAATNTILPFLKKGNLIILESTVPPKTSLDIIIPILEKNTLKAGKDFYYAHCPERAIPGNTLNEMINNNRIIGGFDKASSELTKKLYSSFVKGKIFLTDSTTAEMAKLMENTSRDVNIALANEFAKICEDLNISCSEAIKLANLHPRVNILNPGPGVGGHCIAVDPWFIHEKSPKNAKLIQLARNINDSMPDYVVNTIENIVNNKKSKIAIFGISYKGNVEDTRESPSLEVIKKLKDKQYNVSIFDPYVKNPEYNNLEEAIKGSDCIVFLTDHDSFKQLDIKKISSLVSKKNIFDTRNFLNHNSWNKYGFNIRILGKGKSR